MELKKWCEMQIHEALSSTNRYYYWLHYGEEAKSDNDLMLYYSTKGAIDFSKKHRNERPHGKEETS